MPFKVLDQSELLKETFGLEHKPVPDAVTSADDAPEASVEAASRLLKIHEACKEKTKIIRYAVTALMVLMMVAIDFPALIIAGTSQNDEIGPVFRSLAVVLALFLSGYALIRLWSRNFDDDDVREMLFVRPADTIIGRLETFFGLTVMALILETNLMGLGPNHGVLIIFGILAFIFRTFMLIGTAYAIYVCQCNDANSHFANYTFTVMDLLPGKKTLKSKSLNDNTANWHAAYRLRTLMRENFERGLRFVILMLVVLFIVTIAHFTYEFLKIFSNQAPLITGSIADDYNTEAATKSYFPSRLHNNWKVHVVVVDALRYDLTNAGASSLGNFVNNEAFANHSVRYRASAQLPSFSVPNWMSILTGALPETHGVTGNLFNEETHFDHIYRKAKHYGVHAGITGTPWWADLVFSTLPTLDGDGTVDASFLPEGTPSYPLLTADPADWERFKVALKAVRRSNVAQPFGSTGVDRVYELFLTHFSDVDMQGHEYGISTEWNPDDTYMRALDNKTKQISDLVDAMDNQTVLIITSDHGQVYRGGHGGVTKVLRDTPVIFYTKGSTLNGTIGPLQDDGAAPNFNSGAYPRNENDGFHQNLDICSTVTALLGIPAPRQSTGVFFEEVIQQLVPPASVQSIYYDLFKAKLASVRAYAEIFSTSGFMSGNREPEILTDSEIVRLDASNGTLSAAEYANGVKKLLPAFWELRDDRKNYARDRNIACSTIIGIILMIALVYIMAWNTSISLRSLRIQGLATDLNRSSFISATATIVGFLTISLAVFNLWYAADGYTMWDSTLTHTTSAATPFLIRVILMPIICFVCITKAILFHTIAWKTGDAVRAIRLRGGCTPNDAFTVLMAVFEDIVAFVFATDNYHANMLPRAICYLMYLSLWTGFLTLLVLMCMANFTFLFPIALSTEHVTEYNLQYRFRMITICMMILPLQIGTALLLWFLPSMDRQRDLLGWDHVFVLNYLRPDLDMNELRDASTGPENFLTPTELQDLIRISMSLIINGELRVVPRRLHTADLTPAAAPKRVRIASTVVESEAPEEDEEEEEIPTEEDEPREDVGIVGTITGKVRKLKTRRAAAENA